MEYILFILLMIVVLSVMFYGQIFLYINKYNNLKAIRNGAVKSQQAKQFCIAYMGIYQSGDQPHIQTILKDIEFDPAIESIEEQYMNFNLSPLAIKNLSLEPQHLKFKAKFNRKIIHLTIPLTSITTIYGQSETGFTIKSPPK